MGILWVYYSIMWQANVIKNHSHKNKNYFVDKTYHIWYNIIVRYSVELTEEAISYILSLSTKMQAKIQQTINLLKELG